MDVVESASTIFVIVGPSKKGALITRPVGADMYKVFGIVVLRVHCSAAAFRSSYVLRSLFGMIYRVLRLGAKMLLWGAAFRRFFGGIWFVVLRLGETTAFRRGRRLGGSGAAFRRGRRLGGRRLGGLRLGETTASRRGRRLGGSEAMR